MGQKNKRRLKRVLLEMQRDRCAYCLCPLTMETATLDHLKPRAFGGRNNKLNLVVACMPCNSRRGVMSPIKFWLLKATSGALAVPAEMVR